MYKLLIAEDEDGIREDIKKRFPWVEMGYGIVAEARNGEEAYEKYVKHSPHVVLTDIQMPAMDRFSFVARVRTENPKVKLIVLSGIGNFNDAQQAINLGVSGYLLKPINEVEMKELFVRLKLDLDKACEKEGRRSKSRLDPDMAKVIRYLSHNYSEKNTLQEMANRVHLSPTYFSRQFKLQVGMSFTEYVIGLRMEKAKELLGRTNPPKVIDMALEVGYDDFRYFCKLFKTRTGLSPKQYAMTCTSSKS